MIGEKQNSIEGVVEDAPVGGKTRIVGYVKNGTVYEPRYGGKNVPIGYVVGGIAYEFKCGGKPRHLGPVTFFEKPLKGGSDEN